MTHAFNCTRLEPTGYWPCYLLCRQHQQPRSQNLKWFNWTWRSHSHRERANIDLTSERNRIHGNKLNIKRHKETIFTTVAKQPTLCATSAPLSLTHCVLPHLFSTLIGAAIGKLSRSPKEDLPCTCLLIGAASAQLPLSTWDQTRQSRCIIL